MSEIQMLISGTDNGVNVFSIIMHLHKGSAV